MAEHVPSKSTEDLLPKDSPMGELQGDDSRESETNSLVNAAEASSPRINGKRQVEPFIPPKCPLCGAELPTEAEMKSHVCPRGISQHRARPHETQSITDHHASFERDGDQLGSSGQADTQQSVSGMRNSVAEFLSREAHPSLHVRGPLSMAQSNLANSAEYRRPYSLRPEELARQKERKAREARAEAGARRYRGKGNVNPQHPRPLRKLVPDVDISHLLPPKISNSNMHGLPPQTKAAVERTERSPRREPASRRSSLPDSRPYETPVRRTQQMDGRSAMDEPRSSYPPFRSADAPLPPLQHTCPHHRASLPSIQTVHAAASPITPQQHPDSRIFDHSFHSAPAVLGHRQESNDIQYPYSRSHNPRATHTYRETVDYLATTTMHDLRDRRFAQTSYPAPPLFGTSSPAQAMQLPAVASPSTPTPYRLPPMRLQPDDEIGRQHQPNENLSASGRGNGQWMRGR